MAVSGSQVGLRINRIEHTRLDERGDGRPILITYVVSGKERIPCVSIAPAVIRGHRGSFEINGTIRSGRRGLTRAGALVQF